MNNYWLCITNRLNWASIKEHKIWGVFDRHKKYISYTQVGDKVIIYLISEYGKQKQESIITGVYEIISKPYVKEDAIFSSIGTRHFGEDFPHRINLREIIIPKEPIPFKELVKDMKFITNKNRWSLHLLGKAMKKIPKEDYMYIVNKITIDEQKEKNSD